VYDYSRAADSRAFGFGFALPEKTGASSHFCCAAGSSTARFVGLSIHAVTLKCPSRRTRSACIAHMQTCVRAAEVRAFSLVCCLQGSQESLLIRVFVYVPSSPRCMKIYENYSKHFSIFFGIFCLRLFFIRRRFSSSNILLTGAGSFHGFWFALHSFTVWSYGKGREGRNHAENTGLKTGSRIPKLERRICRVP